MSKFNSLYQTILEDEIFKASTPEEGIRRWNAYFLIQLEEKVERGDAIKNKDGSYDILKGNIDLDRRDYSILPVRFNEIKDGWFDCDNNKLTSLEGSPKYVKHSFFCSGNMLTTLEGAPIKVDSSFFCKSNRLTTLKGAPANVGGSFWCIGNAHKFTESDVMEVCKVGGTIHV